MSEKNSNKTVKFNVEQEEIKDTRELINEVYKALEEKGYNPVNQLVGYLLSGDPAYITNHRSARNLIKKLDRDEILEDIIKYYLKGIS